MAVFNKSDGKPRDRSLPLSRNGAGEGAISIIGPGMRIDGNVDTDGTVRIEGMVTGTVRAAKAVVLGQSGEVSGDIFAHDAMIGGRVKGRVIADNRLELQASCVVEGEIQAPAFHLHLEEGATFNGQIQMKNEDAAQSATATPLRPESKSSADESGDEERLQPKFSTIG